jgi:type I restriction-modification system DNA methylase subunit
MDQSQLKWITGYIWGIADNVLRDLYVRGKYRDVILPMTVLRRLDAVLEPTKQTVLDMKASLDAAGVIHQDPALRQAAAALPETVEDAQPWEEDIEDEAEDVVGEDEDGGSCAWGIRLGNTPRDESQGWNSQTGSSLFYG